MKLTITPTVKLSTLNNSFNSYFPFLKLEFFKVPHSGNEATSIDQMIKEDLKLKDVPGATGEGLLSFDPLTKVHEIESQFKNKYGLNVQVFRKSGNVWLETCGSDEMSLQEENDLGKQKSIPFVKPRTVDFDYD